jgi:hypothetical protein
MPEASLYLRKVPVKFGVNVEFLCNDGCTFAAQTHTTCACGLQIVKAHYDDEERDDSIETLCSTDVFRPLNLTNQGFPGIGSLIWYSTPVGAVIDLPSEV